MKASLTINGKPFEISPASVPIDTSLNSFIRNHANLSGTKFMCLEGGCGACVVTLKGVHPVTKEKTTWAVNSCLQNIYSCHGLDVITVEGLGSKKNGMHQVQKRLANFNGTQCGYCSPGMVMNMYSLLESKNGKVTMEEVENSFGGNICRCTGYRPILDAFKSLATDADESLLNLCKDIEDLDTSKTCPKTGTPCIGNCSAIGKVDSNKPLKLTFNDDREWHKANSIKDIFDVLGKIGDKPYMLVAGNTAHGVYRRSPDLKVFIDISSVEELKGFKVNGNSLEIGGNISLTEAMEIFTKVANENKGFEYLKEFVKHIDVIANVPVRNNGTVAGNLMIKNKHEEFPSDVFIMFEAVGAKITVSSNIGQMKVGCKEFVKLMMSKKVISSIILPKLEPTKFSFRSYKIMPRAQNAHAYVNAAFLFEMNGNNTIASARVCFGGIEPKFVHAAKTEAALTGKDPFSNQTIQAAFNTLKEELNPDWVLPDASPEYRKNLALALFYKFILDIAPEGKLNAKFKSGGKILERELSSGTQVFDTYKKNWPLTKNIRKIEADVQVTGEAKYVNDLPPLPNEVYGAFVQAKKVHGKILSINASRALQIPGVVAFYSAKDIPGENNFIPSKMMFTFAQEEILCSSEVKFHGQPIGIILAETIELANYAAEFVDVIYDAKVNGKIVASIKDIGEKAPERVQNVAMVSKEAEKVGTNTTHKLKGRFEMGSQFHFSMEPQSCVVVPIEDGLDVYPAAQWVDATQMAIAGSLNVPNNFVNINVRRLGGGFGAKVNRNIQVACAAALGAYLSNRPVRFVMTIEANMNIIGKRYPCVSDYEVEVDDNGKIQKLLNKYIEDGGCSPNDPVYFHAAQFFKNVYDDKPFALNVNAALTDTPSNSFCRAPGTTEGIAMIENIMEHIARKTKKDPVDVRLSNLCDGEMKNILPEFVKSVDYYNRKNEINKFNSANRWVKRGIAIVPMSYHLEYFGNFHSLVSIYHGDGSVAVSVGGIEMGQGLNTKVAQAVAHFLDIPLEKVSIKPTSNLTSPNAICTGGSSGSEVSCFASKKACEMLLERLKPFRDENPKATWSEIVDKAYGKNVDLSATYMYKAEDLKDYYIYGASCCEVEVDLLTGNLLIKRVDVMEDVGESLSPGIDVGQIEGAFVFGLGYWLTEGIIHSPENGELLTNRTWTYKPPGAKDIPIDFRVTFLRKSSNPFGVLRSKATGEPATNMSIVAVFALRHALDSARTDSGLKIDEEFYPLGAPTTPETIFLAANHQPQQFTL